ncbi:MAG: metalloregulator ArsR/SmtB family transcription factor [Methylotenera sp.]|uniref:ArsR/SmtB family transcription factor n=1 Tax=Methylotenera sp. TaxID=2051956 RepID=UPI00248794B7|nr:metalloregulator ArsR/SmtB family transcription factor [Methylotenera sp.]MDI1310192.1 metalloregulator ArsR/SmtB family transcription factor [Methylotenera sp.]
MNTTDINIDFELMRGKATQASDFLKTLANPDRLLLLCQLNQREMCVSDLENALAIRQPTLSQQLSVLRTENLVKTRRDGKQIYYSIASQEALSILQLLYKQFCK